MFFPHWKIILDAGVAKIHPYTFNYLCPLAGRAFTFCLETESKQRVQASPSRSFSGARAA
jgi:hypothetical protein